MDKPKKTLKGFTVSRRCDTCGKRIDIAVDEGEKCMLKCSQCGKEYKIYFKAQSHMFPCLFCSLLLLM